MPSNVPPSVARRYVAQVQILRSSGPAAIRNAALHAHHLACRGRGRIHRSRELHARELKLLRIAGACPIQHPYRARGTRPDRSRRRSRMHIALESEFGTRRRKMHCPRIAPMPRGLTSSSSASRISSRSTRAWYRNRTSARARLVTSPVTWNVDLASASRSRIEMNAPLFNSHVDFRRQRVRMPVSEAEIERIHVHIARISRPRV